MFVGFRVPGNSEVAAMGNKAGALDRHPKQLGLGVADTGDSTILAALVREEMTRRDPQGGSGNEAEGRQASNPHSDDPRMSGTAPRMTRSCPSRRPFN